MRRVHEEAATWIVTVPGRLCQGVELEFELTDESEARMEHIRVPIVEP